MQRLLIVTAAIVLLGGSNGFAQTLSAPAMPGAPTTSTSASSGLSLNVPTLPGAIGTNSLGAIQNNLAVNPSNAIGSIAACPSTSLTSTAASDSATAAATGVVVTPTLTSPFGTLSPTGNCIASSQPATTPNVVSGTAFSDAAVPLDATESGAPGLSPLVTVPSPGAACVGSAMPSDTGTPPTLFDSTGATDDSAGTIATAPAAAC
jgi:hypothetical protein